MVINVYKESGMTSRDVVNLLIKHFHTKKIGHTGTLDPLASGVLIICTEEDTKLVDIIMAKTKEYIATMQLGMQTDTGDITGKTIATSSYNVNKNQIIQVLNAFIGTSIQTIPIYSAVKVNGRKLYDYARHHESVTLPQREINISAIKVLEYHDNIIKFKVTVSKGTYIRSLIEDIAKKLGTLGTMVSLERTKQGSFSIQDSYTIANIISNNFKSIPLKDIFTSYDQISLDNASYFKVKNGAHMPLTTHEYVLYTYQDKPVALYQNGLEDAHIYRMFHY